MEENYGAVASINLRLYPRNPATSEQVREQFYELFSLVAKGTSEFDIDGEIVDISGTVGEGN